jgi:hypothetical protein
VTSNNRGSPWRFDDQSAIFVEDANKHAGIPASGPFPIDFLLKGGDVCRAFPNECAHDLGGVDQKLIVLSIDVRDQH